MDSSDAPASSRSPAPAAADPPAARESRGPSPASSTGRPPSARSGSAGSGDFDGAFMLDEFLEKDENYRQLMAIAAGDGEGGEAQLDDAEASRFLFDDAFGSPGASAPGGATGGPPRRGDDDDARIYELVFMDSAVPMAVVTLDGHFLRANSRFEVAAGYAAAELSRATLFNMTAPIHLHVAFSYMSLVLRGLDPASHLFVCAVTRDGHLAPFALAVSLVTRDGRAQYFSTSLVPLSNVPPQLFADDAERERHGCGPSRAPPSSDRVRPSVVSSRCDGGPADGPGAS